MKMKLSRGFETYVLKESKFFWPVFFFSPKFAKFAEIAGKPLTKAFPPYIMVTIITLSRVVEEQDL